MAGTVYDVPIRSEAVDISSTDHTFTIKRITGIYVGGTGNIVATLYGDSGARTYAVTAGQILLGMFGSVTRTNTTATGLIGLSSFANDG